MRRTSRMHSPFKSARPFTRPLKPRRRITPIRHASYHTARQVRPVTATHGSVDVDAFRSLAWEPAVPVHLRAFHRLPAMETWFASPYTGEGPVSVSDNLASSGDSIVSYEFITSSCSSSCLRRFRTWLLSQPGGKEDDHILSSLIDHLLASAENTQSRFLQFDGPLRLMTQASRYNQLTGPSSHRIKQLYIAQSDIRSLPSSLSADLPVPSLVMQAGKGDIYSSSVWLGLQPTYTPLHRDPNPNIFCQLAGSKAVRLLRPQAGLSVFQDVRRRLGSSGSSRFRGPEMMEGPEREELHRAVWVDDLPDDAPRYNEIWQAILSPGDALFIPQGWWHSVRSLGREAEPNASANWWFR